MEKDYIQKAERDKMPMIEEKKYKAGLRKEL